MKQKNIRVVYKSRSIGGSYTQVPKIQMEGRWLEELGFSMAAPSWWSTGKAPCISVP